MGAYSSGEELLVKTRKPYTITKQRERWTDEEHNRFLEALKLYGRAWQRIEEHIGTKTAVQIRSHAQKFFSKLEKEALAKGVPLAQAIDIEIPPPRPKRKPSNPYPRKTGAVSSSPNTPVRANNGKQIYSNPSHSPQVVDLEKEPPSEKHVGDHRAENPKGTCGGDTCSDSTLYQEAISSLETSTRENPATTQAARKLSSFKGFVRVESQSLDNKRRESHAANESNRYNPDKLDSADRVHIDLEKEMAAKSFPRHAPVQILDGSLGQSSQGLCSDVSYQEPTFHQAGVPGHASSFITPAASAAVDSQNSTSRSNTQQFHPGFHPLLNHVPNTPEDYSSILQMSSAFSSLVVSALLQNPAAHAAASFVASLWPSTNVDNSTSSPIGINGSVTPRLMNPAPSTAAIAAATVAAATAWWAAHGMLPLCAPFHSGFSYPPTSVSAPCPNVGQTTAAKGDSEENNLQMPSSQVQQPDEKFSGAFRPDHSASKSLATSSSDSGNSRKDMDIGGAATTTEKVLPTNEQKETSKGKNKKQVDRSSCGSNTPSGSDAETDALGKNEKANEEPKEPDVNHTTTEPSGRRNRIAAIVNVSWKEVSEEGRIAFQALFAHERLPQCFSPAQDVTCREQEMNDGVESQRPCTEQANEAALRLDLNTNAWESVCSDQSTEKSGSRDEDNGPANDGLLTLGLSQGNLTSNRTGFKPYKRCAIEAWESRMMNTGSQDQENCFKRLRLEGEAST